MVYDRTVAVNQLAHTHLFCYHIFVKGIFGFFSPDVEMRDLVLGRKNSEENGRRASQPPKMKMSSSTFDQEEIIPRLENKTNLAMLRNTCTYEIHPADD